MLVTVFCSLTSFAKPPIKATLYSVYYNDPNDVSSYKPLKIIPVNNMTFGVYSDDTLNMGQYLRLYFSFSEVSSISSFHFKFKKLNDWPADSNQTLNAVSIDLCKFNQNGTQTGYTSVRTSCKTSRTADANGLIVYEWTWAGNAVNDRNGVLVSIPFQSFMLDTGPLYFEIEDLAINGEATVFSAGETAIIEQLQIITNVINGDVGEVSQFDPSADVTQSFTDASQAFQNDVDTFTGFINQYNMRTTSERVLFPALLTLSTAGGDLSIILGVCIAACSAGSLIFALRRLHG